MSSTWRCRACDTNNDARDAACTVCGTAAPAGHPRHGGASAPQWVAVRAWGALVFWDLALRAVRVGAVLGVIVALAPVWAAVPRAAALGAALVCLAAAVLARDAFLRLGDALAPTACAPGADLHYREYTPATVSCACGKPAAPDDITARRTTAPSA